MTQQIEIDEDSTAFDGCDVLACPDCHMSRVTPTGTSHIEAVGSPLGTDGPWLGIEMICLNCKHIWAIVIGLHEGQTSYMGSVNRVADS